MENKIKADIELSKYHGRNSRMIFSSLTNVDPGDALFDRDREDDGLADEDKFEMTQEEANQIDGEDEAREANSR